MTVRAEVMLSSLKSYDQWVGTTDPVILAEAERAFGDLRKFYDRFKSELVMHRVMCGDSAKCETHNEGEQ